MPPRKSKLPALLPEGWIVTDLYNKSWKLGKKLGQGGFGLIYLASPASDASVRDNAAYVIKVEDHQNGPLFCELKFYQRAAKEDDVKRWIKTCKLDYLGIPKYWGCGDTTFKSKSYRFMVLDRLGCDLDNVQKCNNGKLPLQAVLQVAVRMLDVLEYIHEHEYVHGDIKAGNILCHSSDPSKVYLADYGLSYRYCPDGEHKAYKEDPRKCHNGTLEFTSLDAHKGVAPSRRGDLEILSFCMLHWLSGRLPWDQDLKVPSTVQAAKQKLMDEAPKSVTAWLGQEDGCNEIAKFMVEVRTLQYSIKPNYKRLKGILLTALESAGSRLGAPLIFSSTSSTSRRSIAAKTKIEELKPHQNKVDDEDDYHSVHPKSFHSAKPHRLQETSKGTENFNTVQDNNCALNRNPIQQNAKNYYEDRRARDADSQHQVRNDKTYCKKKPLGVPSAQYQDWKGKTYWEEHSLEDRGWNGKTYWEGEPLKNPESQNQGWNSKTYWEEDTLEEPDSQNQGWQDIYKYGLTIPVLLLMIYGLIYGVL